VSLAVDLLRAVDTFLESTAIASKNRRLARCRKGLASAMAAAFTTQGKAFVKRLASAKGTYPVQEGTRKWDDWEPLFDALALASIEAFIEPIDLWIAQALMIGARVAIAELRAGISFDLDHPAAVRYLKGHALEAAKSINATTKADIGRIVTQAVEEGWSYNKTAKAIIAKYAEYAEPRPQLHIANRATGIAVYESGMAYEVGGRAVVDDLMDAGLEMEHAWLTVKDERVEPECAANEGQGWIPADQPFQSGHMHPLAHYACRCTCLSRKRGVSEAALLEWSRKQPRDRKGRFARTGPKRPSRIDFASPTLQSLGEAADTRHLYPKNEPGRKDLKRLEAFLTPIGKEHISKGHPKRVAWLSQHSDLARKAVEKPEFVSRHLEHKPVMGRWSQARAVRVASEPNRYYVVVLSLAHPTTRGAKKAHQVLTMYPAAHRDLFRADGRLKDKWIDVGQQKTGP